MPLPVSELLAYTTLRPRTVLGRCQPTLPKYCRTLDGELSRQPSSKKWLLAKYQFSPLLLAPPCSKSNVPRLKLPPVSWIVVPAFLTPSLVWTERAPPSVFRPKTGFDPGINVVSEMAIRGMRSQFTTSPKG